MMKGFCFLRNYNEWRLTDRLLIEIKIIILIHFEIFFCKVRFFSRGRPAEPPMPGTPSANTDYAADHAAACFLGLRPVGSQLVFLGRRFMPGLALAGLAWVRVF